MLTVILNEPTPLVTELPITKSCVGKVIDNAPTAVVGLASVITDAWKLVELVVPKLVCGLASVVTDAWFSTIFNDATFAVFIWSVTVSTLFVVILTVYHFYLGNILNQFNLDQNKRSHKFYRYINEIPTILLILIVFVVIFKPL